MLDIIHNDLSAFYFALRRDCNSLADPELLPGFNVNQNTAGGYLVYFLSHSTKLL